MKNNNLYDSKDDLDLREEKTNKKQIFLLPALVVLVIALLAAGVFFKKKYEISSLEKKAENFAEIQDYDEAIKIYSDLYTKTGNVEFKSRKNQLDIKKQAKDTLEEAKEQDEKGNLVKALMLYKTISKEDSNNYQFASSQIDSLKRNILRKVSSLIDSGNQTEASMILSDYISEVPDDKKAVELYKKISGKSGKELEKVIIEKSAPVVISNTHSNSPAQHTANSITNTYQYITSGQANVRSQPSKAAPVIGSVSRGDTVYVYDTYVESESRIWCKTDLGWISYNTMNNTIR